MILVESYSCPIFYFIMDVICHLSNWYFRSVCGIELSGLIQQLCWNAKSPDKKSDKSGKLELTNIVFVWICHSVVAHEVKNISKVIIVLILIPCNIVWCCACFLVSRSYQQLTWWHDDNVEILLCYCMCGLWRISNKMFYSKFRFIY